MRHTPWSASTKAPPSSVHSPVNGSRCTPAVRPTADAPCAKKINVLFGIIRTMMELNVHFFFWLNNLASSVNRPRGRLLGVLENLTLRRSWIPKQQNVDVATNPVRASLATFLCTTSKQRKRDGSLYMSKNRRKIYIQKKEEERDVRENNKLNVRNLKLTCVRKCWVRYCG